MGLGSSGRSRTAPDTRDCKVTETSTLSSHLLEPDLSCLHHFSKWAANQQQVEVKTALRFARELSTAFGTNEGQVRY